MPKMVELFSGSACISKTFKAFGWNTLSVDWESKFNPDLVKNVYSLDDGFLSQFDFIWLSPDCTTYSIAQHGIHRNHTLKPLSDYAKFCDEKNSDFFARLVHLDIPFIAENPRGFMRKMPFVRGLDRATLSYGVFGSDICKPTDFFTNRFEIAVAFNSPIHYTGNRFDSIPYNDFLKRCEIPRDLLNYIADTITNLYNEVWHPVYGLVV